MKSATERIGRLSIGARLVAGFVAVAGIVLAGTGFYLDHALAEQLAADDSRELASKLPLLRRNLERTRSLEELRGKPHRFMDAVDGNELLSLALREGDRRLIASTGAGAGAALAIAGPAEAVPEFRGERTQIAARDGRRLLVLSEWTRLGDPAQTPVNVVIALDVTHRAEIVQRYRERILIAVAIAALAAGLLGALVSRTGLAPLRSLARRAGTISASRLDARLPADGVPAKLCHRRDDSVTTGPGSASTVSASNGG